MKIILFTDNLGAGGAQRQLVGLAKLLKDNGQQVKIALYNNNFFFGSELSECNIEYEVVKHSSNRFLRIPTMLRYFRKESPDWIIAYQATPGLIASIVKIALPSIKILVSERTTTQVLSIKDKLRFNLYKFADAIVPNSYTQSNFIKKNYSSLSSKITTITNFIDLDNFNIIKKQKRKVPKIIVVATIYETKNTLKFIEAVKILKEKSYKFKVEWFGINNNNQTQYLNNCQKLIYDYHLKDYIELKLKTAKIKEEYNNADFFCLPSLFEGTPNVICEAEASGLPIICSNVCDNARYVKENENGFLFNPKDPKDMAEKIGRCLSMTDDDYHRYSSNSRKIAEQMFSPKEFINKYLSILSKQ